MKRDPRCHRVDEPAGRILLEPRTADDQQRSIGELLRPDPCASLDRDRRAFAERDGHRLVHLQFDAGLDHVGEQIVCRVELADQ